MQTTHKMNRLNVIKEKVFKKVKRYKPLIFILETRKGTSTRRPFLYPFGLKNILLTRVYALPRFVKVQVFRRMGSLICQGVLVAGGVGIGLPGEEY